MSLISGSNGGISSNYSKFDKASMGSFHRREVIPIVSFFINNECQLNCRHCYVGYNNNKNALTVEEWKRIFDGCIDMGTLIFGLAGKEPLLEWPKTKQILNYLKSKKNKDNRLRFGLVTNGLLLDNETINDLAQIEPDYIDISVDGDQEAHDKIRGAGTYKKLIDNLGTIPFNSKLKENIFIAYTINSINADTLKNVISTAYDLNIKNFVVSPYLTDSIESDNLYLESDYISFQMRKLIEGKLIEFSKFNGLNIFFKSDCFEGNTVVDNLIHEGVIDLDRLFIDEYGILFNKYSFGSNSIYFNYPIIDDMLDQTIRISHDGYVSNCFDMFYDNYPDRAIGNIREQGIRSILENVNVHKASLAV